MVNLQLRKLINHQYETDGEYRTYLEEKYAILEDALLSIFRTNSFINYCYVRKLIKLNSSNYVRYTYYEDFKFDDLVEVIDAFADNRLSFLQHKQKIYQKELEIREKNNKVIPFKKKYKLCHDICNLIFSYL